MYGADLEHDPILSKSQAGLMARPDINTKQFVLSHETDVEKGPANFLKSEASKNLVKDSLHDFVI